MASKAPLGFLIVLTIALLVASVLMMQDTKTEGFATNTYTPMMLTINTCPPYANEIQTAKGNTDCCQGDMVDGKCNGTTFCTKSPAYPGVPACVDKWREYYTKKGKDVCPPTMPNYYEDILKPNAATADKGCSAGPISKDGIRLTDAKAPQCRIYPTEALNQTKPDSCSLERQRLKIQCPVVNGKSPAPIARVNKERNTFELFYCQYPFEAEIPDRCLDKITAQQYFDKTNPNWRTNSVLGQSVRNQFCENYIAEREKAKERLRQLELERQRRLAAEAEQKRLQNLLNNSKSVISRLQQQLSSFFRRR
jgi:hypothetical protein